MSLEVDGTWNAGVWATTVWAAGVWREGAAALPDSPKYFHVVGPESIPGRPASMPRDPQVDRDFYALAKMATVQEYLEDVEQWMAQEVGESEDYIDVFEADGLEMDEFLTGKKRSWRRNK